MLTLNESVKSSEVEDRIVPVIAMPGGFRREGRRCQPHIKGIRLLVAEGFL